MGKKAGKSAVFLWFAVFFIWLPAVDFHSIIVATLGSNAYHWGTFIKRR